MIPTQLCRVSKDNDKRVLARIKFETPRWISNSISCSCFTGEARCIWFARVSGEQECITVRTVWQILPKHAGSSSSSLV